MSYRKEFNKIENLNPKQRGFAFEKLINKICDDYGILINASYKTANNSQQIDGAIEINSRIFLLEAKWEKKSTLAASKLYSFLGKINSKLEGTLGIFISYNSLNENFISSIREGLKQNCLIIHGKNDIEDIIDQKINIKEYIWYCYQQASTKSSFPNTLEFASIPKKNRVGSQDVKEVNNRWLNIYKSLTGDHSLQDFSALLEIEYAPELEISKKILNIYSTISFNTVIRGKFKILFEKLIDEEKNSFSKNLVNKLKSNSWKLIADEKIYELFKKSNLNFNEKDRKVIIENVTKVFDDGDWEDENKASRILDIFYESLSDGEIKILANKYLHIYCDTTRKESFFQKTFANKIFKDIKRSKGIYIDIVKEEIINNIELQKAEEFIFEDALGEHKIKKHTIELVFFKYKKVFEDNKINGKKFIEKEYIKL